MTTITTRTRTTIALKGTTFRTSAQLDHRAAITLAWATTWLSVAAGLGVPASGVLRRALIMYAQHLQGTTTAPDQTSEVAAVRRACLATVPAQVDQEAAWERLDATPAGAMPGDLMTVLQGVP